MIKAQKFGLITTVSLLLLVSALLFANTGQVIALSTEQKKAFQSGSGDFFNVEQSGGACASLVSGFVGNWDPLTLEYPAIPDEAQVINNTKQYISDNYSRSPFASNLEYVDQIFILSKANNVNPLLVMAIAKQENGFGQAASSATANNNYFGITSASGYPTVNDYAKFPTVEEGIDYFVEKVGRHVVNPEGPYEGLSNFYEYLSIHQVGLIAYPGEYPEGAPGRDATPPYLTYDRRMDVYTSWDETRNSHQPGSPVYNPGIYYSNSIRLINTLTGLSLSEAPAKGPASPGGCAPQNGLVNTEGYSFPLAPQQKIGYSGLPCSNPAGCHHDKTPAFDLSHPEVTGATVYAITSGTIDKINEQDPGWCQSIQLAADDGYFYWYGHVIDVSVNEGDTVSSGQPIAKVATWTEEHTCAGTSSGAHLHIDRGCVLDGVKQRGGSDSCRDLEFISFLIAIYEKLPS